MSQEMNSILQQAGLNWKVNQEAIQTVSGIEIPEKIALVREDTQKCLGIHTENYVPYQNEELLELLFKISQQTGLSLHSGGSFKEGARVWFQLKSQDMRLHNDVIEIADFKDETIATHGLKYVAEETGCKSAYLFAIKSLEDKFIGILALDYTKRKTTLDMDSINHLQNHASSIGGVLMSYLSQ